MTTIFWMLFSIFMFTIGYINGVKDHEQASRQQRRKPKDPYTFEGEVWVAEKCAPASKFQDVRASERDGRGSPRLLSGGK